MTCCLTCWERTSSTQFRFPFCERGNSESLVGWPKKEKLCRAHHSVTSGLNHAKSYCILIHLYYSVLNMYQYPLRHWAVDIFRVLYVTIRAKNMQYGETTIFWKRHLATTFNNCNDAMMQWCNRKRKALFSIIHISIRDSSGDEKHSPKATQHRPCSFASANAVRVVDAINNHRNTPHRRVFVSRCLSS